jgi:Na+-transporting methylmalonyl-CoA/oxaloacetate decarboxylase gamma subunit
MGNGGMIGLTQSLVYSGLGLSVVFLALLALAIVIVIFSRIFSRFGGTAAETGNNAAARPGPAPDGEDLETLAAVIAAVTEDAYAYREDVIIRSITEIK